jgi:hypothetical protein
MVAVEATNGRERGTRFLMLKKGLKERIARD